MIIVLLAACACWPPAAGCDDGNSGRGPGNEHQETSFDCYHPPPGPPTGAPAGAYMPIGVWYHWFEATGEEVPFESRGDGMRAGVDLAPGDGRLLRLCGEKN